MADKPEPFDVSGMQSSLSDSATRVSTIWISYLLFGLYLLVATGTANHRQLLLEDPLKLPVLSTDVPLFWFFILSPILFVVLHLYVLLQVLLLGRTAAAYNNVINRTVTKPVENALIRERLANTLFAQAFAGAPRERAGWLGNIIQVIAWSTLVAAPIYIVFAFQVVFLPYHSWFATWTHRILVLIEVGTAFVFWPIVLDPHKDFDLKRLRRQLRRIVIIPTNILKVSKSITRRVSRHANKGTFGRIVTAPIRLLKAIQLVRLGSTRKRSRLWRVRWHILILTMYSCLIAASTFLVSFPGEWHINAVSRTPSGTVQCERWFGQRFDRLVVPNAKLIDSKKIAEMNTDAKQAGLRLFEGEKSKELGNRDLSCGIFDFADFRHANLDGARLSGSSLRHARLQGASMQASILDDAHLPYAQLQDVNLGNASLRRTDLKNALLEQVLFFGAHLQAADFSLATLTEVKIDPAAELQGVILIGADLRGVSLEKAQLSGASLRKARLGGSNLTGANLSGADLKEAQIQAADLSEADLSGTRLDEAWLQAAELKGANLDQAVLSETYLWATKNTNCSTAFVERPSFAKVIEPLTNVDTGEPQSASGLPPSAQGVPVDQSISAFLNGLPQDNDVVAKARKRILSHDDNAENATLSSCGDNSVTRPFDEAKFAEFVADRVCHQEVNRKEIAAGIIRNALYPEGKPPKYFPHVARRLLDCRPSIEFSDDDRKQLTKFAEKPH